MDDGGPWGLGARAPPPPELPGARNRGANKLLGQAALITGGDSGIGRAVAMLFAREGADVAIVYLPEEQSDAGETRRAVEAEGRSILLVPGDWRDPAFCKHAVEETSKRFGRLDILVNNAAFQQHASGIEKMSDEQFERTVRTNVFGYFFMARAALGRMDRGASIIKCGSITGLEGSPKLLDDATTKGAIHAFTKSLAQTSSNGASASTASRPARCGLRSIRPIATRNRWPPSSERTRRWAGPHSPKKSPRHSCFFASNADSSYVHGRGADAARRRNDRSLTPNHRGLTPKPRPDAQPPRPDAQPPRPDAQPPRPDAQPPRPGAQPTAA